MLLTAAVLAARPFGLPFGVRMTQRRFVTWDRFVTSNRFVTSCHLAVWPLHVPPPTPHAAAGVEGPPHYHPPPWPRQPRVPCPTLPPTPYYFYITVAHT